MTPLIDLKKDKKQPTVEISHTTELLRWQAYEFHYWPKSKEWYVAIGILAAGFFAVSILTSNFLLGIIIILVFLLLIIYGAKKPRKIDFGILTTGLVIGQRHWKFDELKSFWIFYDADLKEISIENKALLLPRLNLPLNGQDPNVVREILLRFLPEKKHEESLIDMWVRKLRF